MTDLVTVFIECFLAVLGWMSVVFVFATVKRNNSFVDVAWGLGFVLVAIFSFLKWGHFYPRQVLISSMVVIWGLRLATHIFLRNKSKGEDFRYKKWRETWGKFFLIRSYLQIYVLQSVFLLIIASSVIVVNLTSDVSLRASDAVAVAIWTLGFLFEAIGDWQLSRFIKNRQNRGRIITKGLWNLSRHPNYFGEATLWWGIFLMATTVPFGWLTVVSPLLIDFLLLKVSGIPLIEKKYEGNLEFDAYKKQTSAFFPWFHKKV